ncbi:rhodanese-like domain-containing protein [Burkholderiales bacterium]|nr:rhodanese-like domain-containing protein [Burkholderiales bacterium]
MDFISSNIWLVLAIIVSGGYLIIPKLIMGEGSKTTLGPQDLVQLINRQHATVIDLREEKEFELGSIVGSKNITLNVLQQSTQGLKKFEKRPIALICGSGAKSRVAQKLLSKEGYSEVFVLSGGLSAWMQANLPTSPSGK